MALVCVARGHTKCKPIVLYPLGKEHEQSVLGILKERGQLKED